MSTQSDQMQVLDLISQGKITAVEGEELLKALAASNPRPKLQPVRVDPVGVVATGYSPNEGASLAAELRKLGIERVKLPELQEMRLHHVTPEFVREVAALGYEDVELDELVNLRMQNITPDYIREMRAAGLDEEVDFDELIECSQHGVTPEFIRSMRLAGIKDLDVDELVECSDHGVTPEFLQAMRAAGIKDLDVDELVECSDHGVTPDFIHNIHELGLVDIEVDDLIKLADHGVTSVDLRKARRTYPDLDTEELVQLVTEGLDLDDLEDKGLLVEEKGPTPRN